MQFNFKHTLYASYIGYITQAIVNNLAPLLFATFQSDLGISIELIGLLVTINFIVQMAVDTLAARYISRIGYRAPLVFAHLASGLGLVLLGTLPHLLSNPYIGILTAVVFYAIGGGLIEVLISPLVEALPTEQKSSAMSILHSFYCWGHVGVVLLSTGYFALFGIESWRLLPILWAIIPLCNAVLFTKVPLRTYDGDAAQTHSVRKLFSAKIFWVLALLMLCSGASELAMGQWSSYFAETGLGVPKAAGDLLGPCAFAALMGLARLLYGSNSTRIRLTTALSASCVLCIICYLAATLSPHPIVSLIFCGVCGFSVGMLWPGVYSLAAKVCPQGGTAMFALLALSGDIGCGIGPSLVGYISGLQQNANAGIKAGLLCAVIFPLIMVFSITLLKKYIQKQKGEQNA